MPNGFSGPFRNNERNTYCNFTHVPFGRFQGSTAAPSTAAGVQNLWIVDATYFECRNVTTATAAMPSMGTIANNGINIDTITGAAAKTIEIGQGFSVAQLNAFVTNTSLPFYVRATFNVNTLANVTELFVGFRKSQAYTTTNVTVYTDYATIGIHGATGQLQIQTQKTTGGNVVTDTTNVAVAGQNFTIQVNVSGAGVVTYLKDTTGNGKLIAPTTVAAYTFTTALTVVPFIFYTTVTSHTEVDLCSFSCGFL